MLTTAAIQAWRNGEGALAAPYSVLRDLLPPLFLVYFRTLTPLQLLTALPGERLSTLGGLLSNRAIVRAQRRKMSRRFRGDLPRYPHIAVGVQYQHVEGVNGDSSIEPKELLCAEMMARGPLPDLFTGLRRRGQSISRLSERTFKYMQRFGSPAIPGAVVYAPFLAEAMARADLGKLTGALRASRSKRYGYGVLLDTITEGGADLPDQAICSQLAMQVTQAVGILPTERWWPVGSGSVPAVEAAHRVMPAELGEYPEVDWRRAVYPYFPAEEQ